jgi:pyruvate/2-oxoglutarate dehydrogenase complex dihydrolipoamide acyltransferase (E2) component
MRRVIAERMHASLQQSAQLTIGMEVRMDAAAALRDQLNAAWAGGPHVTFTDLVSRAAVMALAEHPLLNSSLEGDEQITHPGVDLGVAVAVAGGLVVPVVRDAGSLTLRALSERTATLADAAGRGGLGPDDMQGSTFTVTSLGAQGVDFFTPIINPPNVAVLGVGRVRDGVTFEDGRPVGCRVLTLSLTFDHRAVDGVPAAEYLAAVKRRLEQPLALVS